MALALSRDGVSDCRGGFTCMAHVSVVCEAATLSLTSSFASLGWVIKVKKGS